MALCSHNSAYVRFKGKKRIFAQQLKNDVIGPIGDAASERGLV
jgi:hypothetical protein